MRMKKVLLGYYNYTVILTYASLVFGVLGIALCTKDEYSVAIICLMLAGLCDMFDGTIAATKRRNWMEMRFGVQIDSLCDLVNFGVLPSMILFQMSSQSAIMILIICIYILCTLIRLAYFNVSEEMRQCTEDGKREGYQGLPVTSVALIFPALYVVQSIISTELNLFLVVGTCLTGIAFIIPFNIKKPKAKEKALLCATGIAEMLSICLVVLPMS